MILKERRKNDTVNKETLDTIISKIIYERSYDIPEYFTSYISDELFVNIVTTYNPNENFSNLEDFVRIAYPSIRNGHTLLSQINWSLKSCEIGYKFKDIVYMFPQEDVVREFRSTSITSDDVWDLIDNYATHNKYIYRSLMELYLKKKYGTFWKFKKSIEIFNNEMEFLIDMYSSNHTIATRAYILPVMYEIFPRAKCKDSIFYDLKEVYRLTEAEVFIDIDGLTLSDIKDYLILYNMQSYRTEIPLNISRVVADAEECTLAHSVYNSPIIDDIKDLIYHTLFSNANNVHLIYWDIDTDKLLDDLACSGVPLRDLSSVVDIFGIHNIKDSTIRGLIASGVYISEVLPYMDNFIKYFELIFSPDIFTNYVYKAKTTRIDTNNLEYIIDLLSIDVDIRISDNKTLPLLDYIIQTNALMDSGMYIKQSVEAFIISQRDLFRKLSPESKRKIMDNKDEWYAYTHYPNIISASDYTRPISWFNDILEENTDAMKYIPFHLIDKELLAKLIRRYGYIEPITSIHYPINAVDVLNMITTYDVGYSYIADLPTTLQMDYVIEALCVLKP